MILGLLLALASQPRLVPCPEIRPAVIAQNNVTNEHACHYATLAYRAVMRSDVRPRELIDTVKVRNVTFTNFRGPKWSDRKIYDIELLFGNDMMLLRYNRGIKYISTHGK